MEKKANYDELLKLLKQDKWPRKYMYKFIVPFDVEKLNALKDLFGNHAQIMHKESKTGKYISFTATQSMKNPEAVIDIYKRAAKIENVITL